jgi:NAD(P)-dependent dehydrogenase (short-subunit alcohol dehydrogenase family)
MPESLAGKRVLVAGGSGGLGSVCVRQLAAEGVSVVIGFNSNQARAETLRDFGPIIQAELADPAGRARLLDAAEPLYGLVVYSGIPARVTASTALQDALLESHAANYAGPILLAREAAERMRESGTRGAIVLVSTMQAAALFPGSTAYAGAKAALLHAARILAKECRGPEKIRVNVVCPGVNRAGMAEASLKSGKYDRYLSEGMVPRFGRAEDVARAVRFFLEPDGYVTGQVLTVDGGLTL